MKETRNVETVGATNLAETLEHSKNDESVETVVSSERRQTGEQSGEADSASQYPGRGIALSQEPSGYLREEISDEECVGDHSLFALVPVELSRLLNGKHKACKELLVVIVRQCRVQNPFWGGRRIHILAALVVF